MITVWYAKMAGIMKSVIKKNANLAYLVKNVMLKAKTITKAIIILYHLHLLTKHLKKVNVGVIAKTLVVMNFRTFKMMVDLGSVTLTQ